MQTTNAKNPHPIASVGVIIELVASAELWYCRFTKTKSTIETLPRHPNALYFGHRLSR